jgi:hypothetical protein
MKPQADFPDRCDEDERMEKLPQNLGFILAIIGVVLSVASQAFA